MSRRKARELALRALYAHEMSGNSVENIITDLISGGEEEEKVKKFAAELLKMSTNEKEFCEKLIMNRAHNWDFDRIAVIDKLVARIAICEFLYFDDIPPKVTIDEAIEIVKQYSTDKSGQFINGILDGVLLDLKKQDLLHKKGRGLDQG